MGDMREYFDAHKEMDKQRKERNLANANPEGWTQHTEYHWSRQLNGSRLDYWPSRNKFQYKGKVMTGDVEGFIKKREPHDNDNGELIACRECGMPRDSGEYHPYAACLMFKACGNSDTVRANIDAVMLHGSETIPRPDSRDDGLIDDIKQFQSDCHNQTLGTYCNNAESLLNRCITALSQASEPAKPKAEDGEVIVSRPDLEEALSHLKSDSESTRAVGTLACIMVADGMDKLIGRLSKALGGGNERCCGAH